MKQTISGERFREAWLDTPLRGPDYHDRVAAAHLANDPRLLLDLPSVCVKSKEKDQSTRFPKFTGVLVEHSREKDRVLVRSHEDGITGPLCIWEGTVAEYEAMWEVD
jgi:hypothetical protein